MTAPEFRSLVREKFDYLIDTHAFATNSDAGESADPGIEVIYVRGTTEIIFEYDIRDGYVHIRSHDLQVDGYSTISSLEGTSRLENFMDKQVRRINKMIEKFLD